MMAELFLELAAYTRVISFSVQVERRFELDKDGRGRRRELKVELAALEDAFGRAEKKDFVLDERPAKLRAGIPAQQERNPAA
jgi:hypothetical protein